MVVGVAAGVLVWAGGKWTCAGSGLDVLSADLGSYHDYNLRWVEVQPKVQWDSSKDENSSSSGIWSKAILWPSPVLLTVASVGPLVLSSEFQCALHKQTQTPATGLQSTGALRGFDTRVRWKFLCAHACGPVNHVTKGLLPRIAMRAARGQLLSPPLQCRHGSRRRSARPLQPSRPRLPAQPQGRVQGVHSVCPGGEEGGPLHTSGVCRCPLPNGLCNGCLHCPRGAAASS